MAPKGGPPGFYILCFLARSGALCKSHKGHFGKSGVARFSALGGMTAKGRRRSIHHWLNDGSSGCLRAADRGSGSEVSLTGGIRPRSPFAFFKHCARTRFDHPWRPLTQTCDRCGISYYAHFDHPQRCPAWMTDEVDRQAAQEPVLLW